jgi:uncharacterized protein (DUF2252 family)
MLGHTVEIGLTDSLTCKQDGSARAFKLTTSLLLVLGTIVAAIGFTGVGVAAFSSRAPANLIQRSLPWHLQLSTTLARVELQLNMIPPAKRRCSWVVEQTLTHSKPKSYAKLLEQFKVQMSDANMFYRGTAFMFWADFMNGGWGDFNLSSVVPSARLADGSPLTRTSTWTWITGDQHLSNFGAWRNRHGEVVFGVNDFDEAAIFDFRMDIWRLATSIYDHARSNGLSAEEAADAVVAFTDEYVLTVQTYVGNERALLYELTRDTATQGLLSDFLSKTATEESLHKQLRKFTYVADNGERRFVFNDDTQLKPVSTEVRASVVAAFGQRAYGATLQKIGWHTKEWDESFFEVRDVAERVNSGVGSFGVPRYYVLLAGHDDLVNQVAVDGVILDVKYTPAPAMRTVLSELDIGWYENLFYNDGQRAVDAQRALTSYTDPFAGWTEIDGKVHTVRQRSPWKAEFDLGQLKDTADVYAFVRQVAVVTATSHARGSVGKAPVQFKEVIASALGTLNARALWGAATARTAASYREQVLLDFECFKDWVVTNFSRRVVQDEEKK